MGSLTLNMIEEQLQTVRFIDACLSNRMIFLVHENSDNCIKSLLVLDDFIENKAELFFHVHYKSDKTVDFSIVLKKNADTVKISNLKWLDDLSYISLTELGINFDKKRMRHEHVSLFISALSNDGSHYIPDNVKKYYMNGYPPYQAYQIVSTFVEV